MDYSLEIHLGIVEGHVFTVFRKDYVWIDEAAKLHDISIMRL